MSGENVRIDVYDYGDPACSLLVSLDRFPDIGEEVEINFDDPRVEFLGGSWGRVKGNYLFPIHSHGGNAAICQLAMAEDDAARL